MELILWRHCDAEPGVPDEARRLTPLGREQAARMAEWLARRLADDCRIIVSPALRARQTAMALRRRFETDPRLAPGCSVRALLATAGWPDARAPVLVVSHQPTLGRAATLLLEGSETERAVRAGEVLWLTASETAVGTRAVIVDGCAPNPAASR